MVLVIQINLLNIKPFQACLTSCSNILRISPNNSVPILINSECKFGSNLHLVPNAFNSLRGEFCPTTHPSTQSHLQEISVIWSPIMRDLLKIQKKIPPPHSKMHEWWWAHNLQDIVSNLVSTTHERKTY
jgi:hypothetical protein